MNAHGNPHLAPVLALWVGDKVSFCTTSYSREGRNLVRNPNVTLTATGADGFLVVEGAVQNLVEPDEVESAAQAYRDRFGWEP